MFPLSAISPAMFIQMSMHVGSRWNCPVGMHASEVGFAAVTFEMVVGPRREETGPATKRSMFAGRSDHPASPNRSQIRGVPG